MNSSKRLLLGVSAALGLAGLSQAQLADAIIINDSFNTPTSLAEDQLLRVDDLNNNGSYQDDYESTYLFQFSPATTTNNYQFRNVRLRVEGGQAVTYFTNDRANGGFRPELLRGVDVDKSGRLEVDEVTQLIDLRALFGNTSQGAEGVVLHPDGSVWVLTDFPGGGIVRFQGGVSKIFIDDNVGATQTLNQNGVLANVDTDDFTRATWARTGIISFIDGINADRTEAIFKYEDLDNDGQLNDQNELTPFLIPTDINANWAANPDFGTVLPSLKITNGSAGQPNQPPFFVGRLNHLTTRVESGVETYYLGCDSSNSSQFAVNINGQGLNGLIFRGQDLNLDGDINDAGEVNLFYDGSAITGAALQFNKILGLDTDGTSIYVLSLNGSVCLHRLTDLNGDGDASDAGEQDGFVWDESLVQGVKPYLNFLFGDGLGVIAPNALPEPISPQATVFGAACSQSGPVTPVLTLWGDVQVGSTNVQARLFDAPAFSAAILWVGASSTNWLGLPLPLDLAGFGLPGCFLYQDLTLSFSGVTNGAGLATFPLTVPSNPALAGKSLPLQAGAFQLLPTAILSNLTWRLDVTIF